RAHELRQTMSVVEPKVFITTQNFMNINYVEMAQSVQAEISSLQSIIALGSDLPSGVVSLSDVLTSPVDETNLLKYIKAHPIDANEVFTICWTSGTEAEPKGVPRSHNHWISIAYATVDGAEIDRGCRLLNPFPLVNMSAIGGMLVPWLLSNGTLVMHHPLNLTVFLGQIKAEKINYTVVPPVLLNMLLINPAVLANADLSSIKNIGSGSAPLSAWMTTQWKEKHNIDILNFFGANEGTALISAPSEIPDAAERARYFPRYGASDMEWKNRAVRGMQTKLIDPITKQTITEPNVAGELAIKGPTIFAGYYNRSDLTAKSFDADGYFYTGDLFEIAGENNDRYRFVGRLKDLIIRGGMKIAPEEIEALIVEHPKVAEITVVGYPDPRLEEEERIAAVVVTKKDQSVTLDEIQDFLKGKDMAPYKMPKKLLVIDVLPRNPVGKILKRDLKAQLANRE
ncbi:MAG TPA: fatty acid--CoA ligase family protein, partial [Candidatus Binatia bacterium]|nr:fatty acid--CoA ligase family protein [Candidatus Binatia bacterium]